MLHHVLEKEVYFLNPYDKILSVENEMYKQLYEESKHRRNQVNAKYAPTITIITAETGAILWIVFKIITDIEECNLIIQLKHLFPVLLATVTAFVWLMAIFFFIICLTNYSTIYINPSKIQGCIEDNKKYLQYYDESDIANNIKLDIINGYKNAAIENWNNNNKHSLYFKKCYICLSLTFVLLVIDFLLVILL